MANHHLLVNSLHEKNSNQNTGPWLLLLAVGRSVSRSVKFSAATAFTINYYYYYYSIRSSSSSSSSDGRPADLVYVHRHDRVHAILPGSQPIELLFTRGVALVIAVEPRRFNRYYCGGVTVGNGIK